MTPVNGGIDMSGGGAFLSDEYGEPYGSDDEEVGEDEDEDPRAEDDDEDEEDEPLVNGSSSHANGQYRDVVDENGTSTNATSSSRPHRASRRTREGGADFAESLSKSNASLCQKGSILILLLVAGGAALRYFMPDATYGPNFGPRASDAATNGTTDFDGNGVIFDPDRPVPTLDAKALRSYRNVQTLRQKFRAARDGVLGRLHKEYGRDNFERMFEFDNSTIGRLVLRSGNLATPPASPALGEKPDDMGLSWNRLRRKVLMKLLQVQILAASSNKARGSGNIRMPTFVWATGGHSAAAAHGDLYNESYSAVLERAVRPALREVGVWFEGKNYAMGGTASSPEVALCSVPIYGTDVDVLSWDFGMTDGPDAGSMEMYFRQASFGPGRPACVAMEIGNGRPRIDVMRHLEDAGVAAFYVPTDVPKKVYGGIPDAFGLNETQLGAVPPLVRGFKCEDAIEKGEPGCASSKWTPVNCTGAGPRFRTSWHPGWKWHALFGNMFGLAILDVVDDALDELAKLDLKDPNARYRELQDEEDREYELFLASEPSNPHEDMIKNRTGAEDFDLSILFNRPSYCHTARLPAETRYLGILTERPDKVGFFRYDEGAPIEQARQEANNGTRPRLAYDIHERQDCSLLMQMDYKDYFFLGEAEGAKSLVLPNDMELLHYPMKEPLLGLVGISMTICDWGHCPGGNLLEEDYAAGEWEMSVNGVPVTGFVTVRPNGIASFARHKDGWHFPPNADGRFEIQVRVNSVGKYLRFSSFILL